MGTFSISLIVLLVSSADSTPFTTHWGTNQWIEYREGASNLIIVAPHGGSIQPDENVIPVRPCTPEIFDGECVVTTDGNTADIATMMATKMYSLTGQYPHVIINRLHRERMDPNRELEIACHDYNNCNNCLCETIHGEFHSYIQQARVAVDVAHGGGLLHDTHGQSKRDRIEVGTAVAGSQLDHIPVEPVSSAFQRQTQQQLISKGTLDSFLRGPNSYATYLDNNVYEATPSVDIPQPGDGTYYGGDYDIKRHGSSAYHGLAVAPWTIDAVQVEFPEDYRYAVDLELKVNNTAQQLYNYMQWWYKEPQTPLCVALNCQNGAGCLDHGAEAACVCTEGWTGPLCDIPILSNQCEQADSWWNEEDGSGTTSTARGYEFSVQQGTKLGLVCMSAPTDSNSPPPSSLWFGSADNNLGQDVDRLVSNATSFPNGNEWESCWSLDPPLQLSPNEYYYLLVHNEGSTYAYDRTVTSNLPSNLGEDTNVENLRHVSYSSNSVPRIETHPAMLQGIGNSDYRISIGLTFCESQVCDNHNCQNGGSCFDNGGVPGCSCTPDYTGDSCEVPINTCPPHNSVSWSHSESYFGSTSHAYGYRFTVTQNVDISVICMNSDGDVPAKLYFFDGPLNDANDPSTLLVTLENPVTYDGWTVCFTFPVSYGLTADKYYYYLVHNDGNSFRYQRKTGTNASPSSGGHINSVQQISRTNFNPQNPTGTNFANSSYRTSSHIIFCDGSSSSLQDTSSSSSSSVHAIVTNVSHKNNAKFHWPFVLAPLVLGSAIVGCIIIVFRMSMSHKIAKSGQSPPKPARKDSLLASPEV